jgi:hypothetical protein
MFNRFKTSSSQFFQDAKNGITSAAASAGAFARETADSTTGVLRDWRMESFEDILARAQAYENSVKAPLTVKLGIGRVGMISAHAQGQLSVLRDYANVTRNAFTGRFNTHHADVVGQVLADIVKDCRDDAIMSENGLPAYWVLESQLEAGEQYHLNVARVLNTIENRIAHSEHAEIDPQGRLANLIDCLRKNQVAVEAADAANASPRNSLA